VSFAFFKTDLACSGTTGQCIHLIGDRFWYNSEKQFNNSLFLEKHCSKGDGSSEQPQGS
jgi:hypothetical protein